MVDVLPHEFRRLLLGIRRKLGRIRNVVHDGNFRPDHDARLVAQFVEIIVMLVVGGADYRAAHLLDQHMSVSISAFEIAQPLS